MESKPVVADRIQQSAVRLAIIAALNDWAVCAQDDQRRKWLLEISTAANHDAMGWASRIYDFSRLG